MKYVDERTQLIEQVMQLNARFVDRLSKVDMKQEQDDPWLSIDLTMPQFKTLMIVTSSSQGVTVGQIAKRIGVGLPTVSGIVDRLYEHGLVTRGEDPDDRRVTRVMATEKGREITHKVYLAGRKHWYQILDRLDVDELQTVSKAFDIIYKASLKE